MNARTLAKCNQGSGYRRPAVHRYNGSQRQCRTSSKKTAEGKARAQFVLRADQISDDLLSLNQKGRASSPTASAPLSVALPRPASNRGARYASSNCFSAPLIYVSRTEISCTSPQCGHLTLSVAFQAARRLCTSVSMAVGACWCVVGQVKNREAICGSFPCTGGSATGLSATGAWRRAACR